jgi:hypothetical protein
MESWNNGFKCILSFFIIGLRFQLRPTRKTFSALRPHRAVGSTSRRPVFHYSNIPPFQVAEKKKASVKALKNSIRYGNSETLAAGRFARRIYFGGKTFILVDKDNEKQSTNLLLADRRSSSDKIS